MRIARKVRRALCLVAFLAAPVVAEDRLGADFRKEADAFKADCAAFSKLASCAELLFTDFPLHIAVGSLAPQNGFGAGVAFVEHYTSPKNWRDNFDMDAIATPNGSWRAGAYATFIWSGGPPVTTGRGRPARGASGSAPNALQEQPVFNVYAQGESLNTISFFGPGPNSLEANRAYFGMTETITGGNAILPLVKAINLGFIGEANGRFVEARGSYGQSSPSIQQVFFTPATAPGIGVENGFAQFGEGLRLRPQFLNGYLRLNYLANYQQYAAGTSRYSFQRFNLDLQHQFPLYKTTRSLLRQDFNPPDQCGTSPDPGTCPPILPPPGPTRNLEGSVNLRFLLTESFVPGGNLVPFYFQPTLGGSDINGNPLLPSFQDYRFRAPNLMLFRASFEHSIYKWPAGVMFMVDEGKVGLTNGDLGFSHLQHSYTAGLTLRAGGFPVMYLLYSWGGHEGSHTTVSMDTSLLGGSARPPL